MSDRPMHTVPGLFQRLEILYADGERAMSERRFDDAVALFSEGIDLDDHFRQRWITLYAQRAFALHNLGRLDEAEVDYAAAIELGEPPQHQARYHFQRGMCLAGLGRIDEAVASCGRAIALAPGQPGPYHLRGKLLCAQLGRPEDALIDFDTFLRRARHPEVLQLRGWCLLELGRPAEALEGLRESAEQAPAPWTSYLLAWAAAATGDDALCLDAIAATLAQDQSFRHYFLELDDYGRVRADPRFAEIVVQEEPLG